MHKILCILMITLTLTTCFTINTKGSPLGNPANKFLNEGEKRTSIGTQVSIIISVIFALEGISILIAKKQKAKFSEIGVDENKENNNEKKEESNESNSKQESGSKQENEIDDNDSEQNNAIDENDSEKGDENDN